jgi:hypothetical protein
MDGHDLVELGAGGGIDGDGGFRRHPAGASAHVSDDDLVAQPVHLEKGDGAQFAGSANCLVWPAHPALWLYMAELSAKYQRAGCKAALRPFWRPGQALDFSRN